MYLKKNEWYQVKDSVTNTIKLFLTFQWYWQSDRLNNNIFSRKHIYLIYCSCNYSNKSTETSAFSAAVVKTVF